VLSEYLESGYASDGLKRLVNRGCRYPGAYTTFSQSLPSHASLFTGRYPYETGAMLSIAADGSDVGSSLRPDCDTLAEVLGRNGYESIAILHNPWLGPPFGLEAGFQTFVNIKKPERIGSFIPELVPDVFTLGKYLEYLQSEFIRRSEHPHARLFRSWFESRDRSRPFFLFLHFIDLHWPNDPPKQYREKFCRGEFADLLGSELDARIKKKEFSEAQMPAVRRQLRALNLAFFAQIDDWLQPVFETLENEGVFDDTMVVFTSDHGDNLHENPQGYGHSQVYQAAIKVPLVICAPGRGSRAEHPGLASLIDVAPTAYAFTGVAPPPGLPGIDLLARQGDVIAPERSIFVMGVDVTRSGECVFAELKDSFKCVSSESAGVRLYDLSADPMEEHDLAGEMPDRANEMKLTLDRYISLSTAASRELMNPEDLSSDTAADLRKLKYLK
jgi:arylsulfatase A-like enzyme